METERAIYFDMDGTIADLYSVTGWLDMLRAGDATPYELAAPLIRLSHLARLLNNLQQRGYTIGIVSWLSKNSSRSYEQEVTEVKKAWLKKHLKSVKFDEIKIVKYGTPKSTVVNKPYGILFDDEEKNRTEWKGKAFDVTDILNTLREMKR